MKSFLYAKLQGCGTGSEPTFQSLNNSDDFVEYYVRNLRGCVIRDGQQWEWLQISFVKTGENDSAVNISVDGWVASGLSYPQDSQFTQSMQPGYSGELQTFSQNLLSGFDTYLESGIVQ